MGNYILYKAKDVKVDSHQELDSFEYDHLKDGIREKKKDKIKDDDEEYSYEDFDDVDA